MLIPENFSLGAVEWSVELRERLVNNYMGLTDLGTAHIQIENTNCRSVIEQTFCHELVHCILFSMGRRVQDHNEEFVDAFGYFLHQYLVQYEQALDRRET